jgi:hypothetical protein
MPPILYLFYSPVFHYYLSKCLKEVCSVSPLWVYFTFVCSTPSIALHYPFISQSPFFNMFQYVSLYPLSSQMLCFRILLMLYHSLFPSIFPWVLWGSSTITNMFFVYVLIFSIHLSHMRETMWSWSFWAWLTSLIWCPQVVSIYFQTTCY